MGKLGDLALIGGIGAVGYLAYRFFKDPMGLGSIGQGISDFINNIMHPTTIGQAVSKVADVVAAAIAHPATLPQATQTAMANAIIAGSDAAPIQAAINSVEIANPSPTITTLGGAISKVAKVAAAVSPIVAVQNAAILAPSQAVINASLFGIQVAGETIYPRYNF